MVPVILERALRSLRGALTSEERIFIEADADADGIAAGHIIRTALEREGVGAEGEAVLREWVHPSDAPLLLADLALQGRALEVVKNQDTAYALDHHRWAPGAQGYLKAHVNTHLLGIENPQRWNTGLLAFIMFRDVVPELGWLAAASSYADRTYGAHVTGITGTHEPDKIKKAGERLGALSFHPDVDVRRVFDMLEGIASLDEFLDNTRIDHIHTDVEREARRYTESPADHALVYDPGRRVMVIHVDSRYPRIRALISTTLSDRHPDWIVCVLQRHHGRLFASLRFQNAEQAGLDMGAVARKIGKMLFGEGGGHRPAAGVSLPASVTADDFVSALYRALAGRT